jgi:hypothetical protein
MRMIYTLILNLHICPSSAVVTEYPLPFSERLVSAPKAMVAANDTERNVKTAKFHGATAKISRKNL